MHIIEKLQTEEANQGAWLDRAHWTDKSVLLAGKFNKYVLPIACAVIASQTDVSFLKAAFVATTAYVGMSAVRAVLKQFLKEHANKEASLNKRGVENYAKPVSFFKEFGNELGAPKKWFSKSKPNDSILSL